VLAFFIARISDMTGLEMFFWIIAAMLAAVALRASLIISIMLLWSASALAQQTALITLACNGTSKFMVGTDLKPDPVENLGIIVSFADRIVTVGSYRVAIESFTSTTVVFHSQQELSYAGTKLEPVSVDGTIDRVTGATNVEFTHERVGDNTVWDLICKPATRLF
jgi:hypothetical protein